MTADKPTPFPQRPAGLPPSSPLAMKAGKLMAANVSALLMGQFRHDDAMDPEVFTTALIALLAEYPPVVLEHICSPMEGLPSQGTFMPSIFEVKEACNKRLDYLFTRWKIDALPPERRARFDRFAKGPPVNVLAPPDDDDTQRRRAFIADQKAKHGEKFGLGTMEESKPKQDSATTVSLGDVTEHYRTHGLQFQRKPFQPEKNDADQD
jgi:hypothetical protein